MDKITNNIVNNLPKKDVNNLKPSLDHRLKTESTNEVLSSNIVDIKNNKILVKEMAHSAPIDVDKVAKIKEAISSGNYPLDLDKLSDALMQAYREMKS